MFSLLLWYLQLSTQPKITKCRRPPREFPLLLGEQRDTCIYTFWSPPMSPPLNYTTQSGQTDCAAILSTRHRKSATNFCSNSPLTPLSPFNIFPSSLFSLTSSFRFRLMALLWTLIMRSSGPQSRLYCLEEDFKHTSLVGPCQVDSRFIHYHLSLNTHNQINLFASVFKQHLRRVFA